MSLKLDLYVVTDDELSRGRGHVETARLAAAGGADVVQLRDKGRSGRELMRLAEEMLAAIGGTGAILVVNDRLDVALAAGAHGVHLGQDDLPVAAARRLAPPGFIIGASVSSVEEAVQAEKDRADYVALSPLFSTPSKRDAGPGLGLAVLKSVSEAVSIPVIAIGGINCGNAAEVIRSGAVGIAVISAVVGQPDVREAARELKALVLEAKAGRRKP